jgi:hypothetical protein
MIPFTSGANGSIRPTVAAKVTSRSVVWEGVGRSRVVGPATVALRLVESCEDDDERRATTMAETKRMTTEEVVGYLLEGEGLDFLRESLAWVVQQLMRRRCRSWSAPLTVSGRRRSG